MATSKVPCDHGDHHPAAVLFDGEDLKLLRIIATSAPHVLELEVLSKPDTAELCRKALALVDGRDHLVLRRASCIRSRACGSISTGNRIMLTSPSSSEPTLPAPVPTPFRQLRPWPRFLDRGAVPWIPGSRCASPGMTG